MMNFALSISNLDNRVFVEKHYAAKPRHSLSNNFVNVKLA
jgi:hypothetical protein